MRPYTPLVLLFAVPFTTGLKEKTDVGKLPALGWNSWNAFACNVNETIMLTAAQKIVELGLKDAGYEYINVDDCWANLTGRDPVTNRLMPNTTKFPSRMDGLAAQVHAMGLKFGIYSTAGTKTCAGYPASLGFETIDAQTFADWQVDYLKYDNCNVPANWSDVCSGCVPDSAFGGPYPNGTCTGLPGNFCPAGFNYTSSNTAERYRIMRDALLATERPILYSITDWGLAGVQEWGAETGHSWRCCEDIGARWSSILEKLNENSFYMNHVNFYGRSDPDMLEVGNGALLATEVRTHFAFWAAMKGPLLIGTDLTKISNASLAVLKNKVLLEFSQDNRVGKPAMPYKWGTNPDWTFNASFPAEYWSGTFFPGGSQEPQTLTMILNVYSATQVRNVTWNEVPQLNSVTGDSFNVMDGWTGEQLGCFTDSVSVNVSSHDTAVLVIQDKCTV